MPSPTSVAPFCVGAETKNELLPLEPTNSYHTHKPTPHESVDTELAQEREDEYAPVTSLR
jgi:hypothetical protein